MIEGLIVVADEGLIVVVDEGVMAVAEEVDGCEVACKDFGAAFLRCLVMSDAGTSAVARVVAKVSPYA